MRFASLVRTIALATWLGGCAALAGLEAPSETTKAGVETPDADGPDALDDDGGDGPLDGGQIPLEDSEPTPCAPGGNAEESPGLVHAQRLKTAPVINGEGSDWKCVDRYELATGDRAKNITANAVSTVALQWDEGHLYYWAKATTTDPTAMIGVNDNYRNDCIHFFVMAPGPTGSYRPTDHHIVFDAIRQISFFGDVAVRRGSGVAGVEVGLGIPSTAGGLITFEVEAKISAAAIGRTAFAAGDQIRVNFMMNDSNPPAGALGYRLWFVNATACPSKSGCNVDGTSEAYCDTKCTGAVVLK